MIPLSPAAEHQRDELARFYAERERDAAIDNQLPLASQHGPTTKFAGTPDRVRSGAIQPSRRCIGGVVWGGVERNRRSWSSTMNGVDDPLEQWKTS